MGTDYAQGFVSDGEGPVRPVALSPFEIDTYPVTNADFAIFVSQTGYITDTERFGSSFVFQAQVPDADLVIERLATAPWWCLVKGVYWSAPGGPGSDRGQVRVFFIERLHALHNAC